MRKYRNIGLSILLAMALVACSTFIKNSYLSMDATGITYNTAMTGLASAQAAGKITTDQRATINKGGGIFYASWLVAIDGLLAYKKNPSTDTQTAVQFAITQFFANWGDLALLINSIIPGGAPVTQVNMIKLKGKNAAGEKLEITIKKLDSGQIAIIIQIGSAVLQYLIPAVQTFINDMGKITISEADILALKTLIKPPQQY